MPDSRLAVGRVLVLVASLGGLAAPGIALGDKLGPLSDEPGAPAGADAGVQKSAPPEHQNPRAKATWRRFSVANLDRSTLWLDGGEIDLYALSRRYIRVGVQLGGGGGKGTLMGSTANLFYGLGGASVGFQYPMRVTPFVDAHFSGGVFGGKVDGTFAVTPTQNVSFNGTLATWMYEGGIDGGIEVYTVGRLYVSAAIGWTRPTWHGVDYAAMKADPAGGVKYKDLTSDSVSFKLGIGI